MKAWLLDAFNGLNALRPAEVPDPVPADGEVLLDVLFAGLNPADRYLAEAQYPARPAMPHILGRDGLGIVRALGTGVSGVPIGEKRILLRSEIGVNRPGTFAARVAVPAESLVTPPMGWTDEESAGAALVYLTAFQAITSWNDLPPRSVVLVTGASGGVGVAAVHLAKALGHTVAAQSRDPAKADRLRAQGADLVLNPNDPDWPSQLKARLNHRRVDLVIDNIGGDLFNAVLATLADRGRISCVGRLAGPVPQFNTASLFFRRIRIAGIAVGAYTAAESLDAWSRIVNLLEHTGRRPLVDSVFAFTDLPSAFDKLARGSMGKVLLRVED